jgi:hypothetical protein
MFFKDSKQQTTTSSATLSMPTPAGGVALRPWLDDNGKQRAYSMSGGGGLTTVDAATKPEPLFLIQRAPHFSSSEVVDTVVGVRQDTDIQNQPRWNADGSPVRVFVDYYACAVEKPGQARAIKLCAHPVHSLGENTVGRAIMINGVTYDSLMVSGFRFATPDMLIEHDKIAKANKAAQLQRLRERDPAYAAARAAELQANAMKEALVFVAQQAKAAENSGKESRRG